MRRTRKEREKEGKGAKDEMDVGRLERSMRGFVETMGKMVGMKQEGKENEEEKGEV